MFKIFGIFILLLTLSGCDLIKYETDVAFLNSAHANSPEQLVKINGNACKDMHGFIGLCAGRIYENKNLTVWLPIQPGQYKLYVTCSSTINFNETYDVPGKKQFSFVIPHTKFQNVKVFNCIGDIFKKSVTSKFFEFRMRVVNKKYTRRGSIKEMDHDGNKYVLFGKYARYGYLWSNKRTVMISKVPALKIESNEVIKFAWSCSDAERCNHYGY